MMGGPGMQGMVRPGQFALQQFVFLLFYKHLFVFVFVKDKDKVFQPPLCVQLQHPHYITLVLISSVSVLFCPFYHL